MQEARANGLECKMVIRPDHRIQFYSHILRGNCITVKPFNGYSVLLQKIDEFLNIDPFMGEEVGLTGQLNGSVFPFTVYILHILTKNRRFEYAGTCRIQRLPLRKDINILHIAYKIPDIAIVSADRVGPRPRSVKAHSRGDCRSPLRTARRTRTARYPGRGD